MPRRHHRPIPIVKPFEFTVAACGGKSAKSISKSIHEVGFNDKAPKDIEPLNPMFARVSGIRRGALLIPRPAALLDIRGATAIHLPPSAAVPVQCGWKRDCVS